MKHFLLFIILLITINVSFSQTPLQFKYQAVLRDANGGIISSQNKSVSIAILKGSITGISVFAETHMLTTTSQGVININIGSVNTSDFSTIDWSSDNYFIKITVDGIEMGVSQLLSVPYALNAKKAETADYHSLTNLPDLNITNWNNAYNWGNHAGLYRAINWTPTWSDITAKPFFSAVATTGNYEDLLNKPTISSVETDPVFTAHVANGITSALIGNWNTAFSWGDHTSAGYLKSYTENDPLFTVWDKKTGITITKSQISDLPNYLTSYTETQNLSNVVSNSGDAGNRAIVNVSQIGIGTNAPDNRSVLDIKSNTKGVLLPQFTDAERDALGRNIPNSMLIFNTTAKQFQVFIDNVWYPLSMGTGIDASTIPTVMTAPASSIGLNTATVNGMVNANKSSTNITFEYGLTASYGTTVTATQNPVTGSTNTSVSVDLNGLTVSTTYHFRIKGVNAFGTVYSNDLTFSTNTSVTTGAITNITAVAATVTGNWGETLITRGVCWSKNHAPTISDFKTIDAGTGTFTSSMTGLTPATTYYVRAFATNGAGTSYGTEVSFQTSATLATGDYYQGGIIFYVTGTYPNQHGLVCALSDQSLGVAWCNGSPVETGATGTAVGTGQANTTAIISVQGEGYYAAKFCDDYTDGSFSDWFLPSKDELSLMDINLFRKGLGSFNIMWPYWSSTEDNAMGTFTCWFNIDYGYGVIVPYEKSNTTIHLRAIRAF